MYPFFSCRGGLEVFGHFELVGLGIVVRIGIPGIEAGLGQAFALRVVGVLHLSADGFSCGGVQRCPACLQVFDADEYEGFDAFARYAGEEGDDPGKLPE